MAGKQPSTTTQIQKVELPKWVDEGGQKNYQLATEISERPYEAYNYNRVAGWNNMDRAANRYLTEGAAGSSAAFGDAMTGARSAMDYQGRDVSMPTGVADVTAQSFLSRNINDYMDPFNREVTDYVTQGMQDQRARGMQGIQDSAIAAGARTGSRNAIERAVYGAQADKDIAGTRSQLRSAAFSDAAARISSDNAQELQARLANQNSALTTQAQRLQAEGMNQGNDLAAAQLRLSGAGLAGQMGTAISDTAGRNALLSSQLGAAKRDYRQKVLDSRYEKWADRKNYDTEALNLRMAALGMTPYGKTSTTTSTQSGGSSNGMMTGIGAAATLLPILFGSDRKIKKKVKKLGKVEGTDLNKYEFEYKGGFMGRTPPGKQVGLMAQDVEKKVPGAVHKVKGPTGKTFKAVDYEMALADAPRKGRNDKGKVRKPYKPRGVGIGSRMRAA